MRLLLDNVTFLWFVQGSELLSAAAKDALVQPSHEAFVSAVTAWKISMRRLGLVLSLLVGCAPTPMTSPPPDARPSAHNDARSRLEAARAHLDAHGVDEVISLTRDLVRFRTVSARGLPPDNPAFAEMARYLERWSEAAGLAFEVIGPHDAWEVRWGAPAGPRKLGFVMHADVVPATAVDGPPPEDGAVPEGWSLPPFEAEVREGRLYGRGTEDDKAPIAAVLVVMRTLERFGLHADEQLLAIIGTAEEHDWTGMRRYARTSTRPEHVISVDSGYPVVVAESGFVAWKLGLPFEPPTGARGERPRAVFVEGGQFLTQVPGEATLTLEPPNGQTAEAFAAVVREIGQPIGEARGPSFSTQVRVSDGRVLVGATGRAVHSSTADQGHNALWLLSELAERLELERNGITDLLRLIRTYFDGDHFGDQLGLAYSHPSMLPLLVAPTMLRVDEGTVTLAVNMRRPAGPSNEAFAHQLDLALARINRRLATRITVQQQYVGEAALADVDGALVPTLMDIYRAETNDPSAQPKSIRGGTYARLFPGAVSFGPAMPGTEYTGHGPDEHIELSVLRSMLRMTFEASVRLMDLSRGRRIAVAGPTGRPRLP